MARIIIVLVSCFALFSSLNHRALAQVNTENLRRADLAEGFHNSVKFEFGFVSGNSEYLNLTSGFRTDFVYGEYNVFGVVQYQRVIQDDEVFINKGFVHLRGIRELAPSFYGELFVQKEFNDFILLKDRNLIGGGIRVAVLSPEHSDRGVHTLMVNVGIGTMWENEDIDTSPPSETNIFRSTNYISISWRIDERMNANLVSYYQVHPSDVNDFRILLESGFGYTVTRSITVQTSFNVRYDNEPPPHVRKHDLEIKNGLRFSF